ncbi:MAG TPA: alanine--tRNA ligase [Solirubrobacteraceae bacterium]|jgi:alanyl-tRNA synthetase
MTAKPAPISTDEIRERYLSFFADRGHLRIPSASLVPSSHDPSALLTVAGMHPLKPYFLGEEQPPSRRLTDCQKCFRTIDIDEVGNTSRHLTFFEMLGNFSIGDYFKKEAISFAWELSLQVFGFDPEQIWVTVFAGDDQLGIGPDEEAISLWREVGVPSERIVPCPRSENFWQAGPKGPCGPCSELYFDRGESFGASSDLPGGENERFLEYWNLVFMQYLQEPENVLAPLPAANIDTGLGLNRMAAILQDKPSVFETDQFAPLIALGESLSGRQSGESREVDRALRILADHTRAMSFLIADGVVPSNEDRGYVLRRVMRRAILQGRTLGLTQGFLIRYADLVRELMASSYPELVEQREAVDRWLGAEEESFGRTLEQGLAILKEHIERAGQQGDSTIAAEDAFKLHDTYGFPFELTRELLAEAQLGVDESGFESLMDEQRSRARAAASSQGPASAGDAREQAQAFAAQAGVSTRFTGYETERQHATVMAVSGQDGRLLLKLDESPFYATGGGQVSDGGVIACEHGDCEARVERVLRLGDDQVIEVSMHKGVLAPNTQVLAEVDHIARHATECNHTATHLLHAALRKRLGGHVRQAGSYVGPDKLRFDFTHSAAMSEDDLRWVEDEVNAWVGENEPVRPLTTTLDEAKRLGAMALFGEKYGEVVRMVEIGDGDRSRELCGGTHVRRTSEIGPFLITSETSSAANVRRIEALTGPAAVQLLRERNRLLAETASALRVKPESVPEVSRQHEQERKELQRTGRASGNGAADGSPVDLDALIAAAEQVDGATVLASAVEVGDAKALLEVLDRLKGRLPKAAIALGAAGEGRVHLVASVSPDLVKRGVKAGSVVKAAAAVAGGGGGGRDTMAQAGGKHPERLPDAVATARETIIAALAGKDAG